MMIAAFSMMLVDHYDNLLRQITTKVLNLRHYRESHCILLQDLSWQAISRSLRLVHLDSLPSTNPIVRCEFDLTNPIIGCDLILYNGASSRPSCCHAAQRIIVVIHEHHRECSNHHISSNSINVTNILSSHCSSKLLGVEEAQDSVRAVFINGGALDVLGRCIIVVHIPGSSWDSNAYERNFLCACVILVYAGGAVDKAHLPLRVLNQELSV